MKQVLELPRIKVEYAFSEGLSAFKLDGDVGEDFDTSALQFKKTKVAQLDLSGIKTFNSVGIRQWIAFLKSLSAAAESIEFLNCSVVMMDQFNLVSDSIGKGKIVSFYAPYYCAEHGERNCLLKTSDLAQGGAPQLPCILCEKPMEFDALEEVYFGFLGPES